MEQIENINRETYMKKHGYALSISGHTWCRKGIDGYDALIHDSYYNFKIYYRYELIRRWRDQPNSSCIEEAVTKADAFIRQHKVEIEHRALRFQKFIEDTRKVLSNRVIEKER